MWKSDAASLVLVVHRSTAPALGDWLSADTMAERFPTHGVSRMSEVGSMTVGNDLMAGKV